MNEGVYEGFMGEGSMREMENIIFVRSGVACK